MKLKDKVKTYSFWTGLSASVILLAQSVTRIFGVSIDGGLIDNIIMSVCGVLIVFGLVNAPAKNKEAEENKNTDEEKEPEEKDENNEEKENKKN